MQINNGLNKNWFTQKMKNLVTVIYIYTNYQKNHFLCKPKIKKKCIIINTNILIFLYYKLYYHNILYYIKIALDVNWSSSINVKYIR